MGITGLLPFLKNATRPASIKEFKGCTVAIDSYCWLHKGAFACAEKLALGEPTDQYVYYCMKYVNNLLSYGVRPILVFDGCHLPSKKEVEKQRRERRNMNRKKAAQLLREGRRSEAREALQKCVDVTSHMAVELMNACRAKGVDCIVAPYEADAQLAYLNKAGIAQVVITEDSDLVLFGCDKIMFKMDFAGNGVLVESEHLNKAMGLKPDIYTFDKFRYMCILSGCDYLASLPGIGLKKATKIFQRTRQTDMRMVLKKIPTTLNMNVTVSADYVEGFFKALNTFLYQLVFDPIKRRLVPLNPYADDVDPAQLLYAGPPLEEDKAYQLALGNLDVHSGARIGNFDPDTFKPSGNWDPVGSRGSRDMLYNLSIWDKNYRPRSRLDMGQDRHKGSAFDISRGTTRGKEVKVSLPLPGICHKKVSPRKRHREEGEACLSERQLADLYTSQPVDSDQPPYKKRKSEDGLGSERVLPIPRLVDTQCENNDGTEREQFGSPTRPLPELDDPSQGAADKIKLEAGDVTAETPSKSPHQCVNKFRVSSSWGKKNRFSLNATTTEVTSRFFSAKKPFKKSEFFEKIAMPHSDSSIKLEATEGDEATGSGDVRKEGDCDNDDEAASAAKHKQESDEALETEPEVCENYPKNDSTRTSEKGYGVASTSPYGSFGFKKNMLHSFRSHFDKDSRDNTNTDFVTISQQQFKPVSGQNSAHKHNIRAEMETSVQETAVSSCDLSQASEYSQSSGAPSEDSIQTTPTQRSVSLWSLDSFSLSQNPMQTTDGSDEDVSEATLRGSACGEASKPLTGGVQGGHVNSTKAPSQGSIAIPPSKSFASGKSPKGGCRSAGLSKKSKSFSSKENRGKGQKSITNFFNKFSYDKSAKKQVGMERKALSPNRENHAGTA